MRIWKEHAYQFFQVIDESLVLQNFYIKQSSTLSSPAALPEFVFKCHFPNISRAVLVCPQACTRQRKPCFARHLLPHTLLCQPA